MRGFAKSGEDMSRKMLLPFVAATLLETLFLPSNAMADTGTNTSGAMIPSVPAGAITVQLTAAAATAVNYLGNGMSSITYSNGQILTVPTSVAARVTVSSSSGPSPDNTVTGNCGSSWVYLYKNGTTGVTGNTGYNVNSRVGVPVAFQWVLDTDNVTWNQSQRNQWDGATNKSNWTGHFAVSYGFGTYESHLFEGYVIGTLNTCFSVGVRDTITTP
jgi:hypothetical protein